MKKLPNLPDLPLALEAGKRNVRPRHTNSQTLEQNFKEMMRQQPLHNKSPRLTALPKLDEQPEAPADRNERSEQFSKDMEKPPLEAQPRPEPQAVQPSLPVFGLWPIMRGDEKSFASHDGLASHHIAPDEAVYGMGPADHLLADHTPGHFHRELRSSVEERPGKNDPRQNFSAPLSRVAVSVPDKMQHQESRLQSTLQDAGLVAAMKMEGTGEKFEKVANEASLMPSQPVANITIGKVETFFAPPSLPALPPAESGATTSLSLYPISQSIKPQAVVKTLRLHLQPAHLGDVSVSLSLKNQELHLSLEVRTAEAQAAIQRDDKLLSDIMTQAGYDVGQISVSITLKAEPAQQGPSFTPQGSSFMNRSEGQSATAGQNQGQQPDQQSHRFSKGVHHEDMAQPSSTDLSRVNRADLYL